MDFKAAINNQQSYCLLKHIYWANESTEHKGYCEGWSGVDKLFVFID